MSLKLFLDTKVFSSIGVGGPLDPGGLLKPPLWSLANIKCVAAVILRGAAVILRDAAVILHGPAIILRGPATREVLKSKILSWLTPHPRQLP